MQEKDIKFLVSWLLQRISQPVTRRAEIGKLPVDQRELLGMFERLQLDVRVEFRPRKLVG